MKRIMLGLCIVLSALRIEGAERPLREQIDERIAQAYPREKVTPAPLTTDAEFIRRVYLDLIGCIPTAQETRAFLNDSSADKRARLIDTLLVDARYAQHMADLWDMILFGRNPPGYDTDKRQGIQTWLREQFAANTPYDKIAAAILKAEGNTLDQGPPTFLLQYRNQPEDATEAITQIFLGVQLQCARCHDHPFEPWKQVDFYGMAAFIARLEVVTVGKEKDLTKYAIGEKNSGDILFTGPAKDQTPGKKGDPIRPRFLLGDELSEPALPVGYKEAKFEANKPPPAPTFSRKDQLAAWVTRAENPFFARAVANRLWALLLGRGLVHPVDNMSPANKPSHPELLDELTHWLVAHAFDVRGLLREVANSRTYQLASRSSNGEQFPRWFESARMRPLSAEELIESWRTATGYEEVEKSAANKSPRTGRFRPLESGYMLRFFGQPNTGTGDFQGGLAEHLYLNNGPLSQLLVDGPGSLMAAVTQKDTPLDARVEHLYLSLLSRLPSDVERARFVEYVRDEGKTPGERWREATWALMTSSEFRFNH